MNFTLFEQNILIAKNLTAGQLDELAAAGVQAKTGDDAEVFELYDPHGGSMPECSDFVVSVGCTRRTPVFRKSSESHGTFWKS